MGAYTELYSGLSPELTVKDNGAYIAPWGKVGSVKADRREGCKSVEEGGTGAAERFWEWSEKEVEKYA